MNNTNMHAMPRRPRRVWPWVLGSVVLLGLLAVAGGVWALLALAGAAGNGLHVVLNGHDWTLWSDWDSWQHTVLNPEAWQLSLSGVVLVLLLVVLAVVLVPLIVVLALLGTGLGLALALVATVLSVITALSPLLLVALVLWLLLRDKPARQFDRQATHNTANTTSGTARMAP